jgi:hypothetical protein
MFAEPVGATGLLQNNLQNGQWRQRVPEKLKAEN